jgi:hypothetical protein
VEQEGQGQEEEWVEQEGQGQEEEWMEQEGQGQETGLQAACPPHTPKE